MFFELGFEAFEQGEGIRGTAGKARQNFLVIQTPHLAGTRLDDDMAQRNLTVAPERYAKYPDGMQDALNGALSRLVELVERDPNLQAHFKRHQLEFGWERPTWESEQA
jgi:hypothetical protein